MFYPTLLSVKMSPFGEAIKWQFLSKWVLGWLESVNQISCSSPDPVFIWKHESTAQATGELRRRDGA